MGQGLNTMNIVDVARVKVCVALFYGSTKGDEEEKRERF